MEFSLLRTDKEFIQVYEKYVNMIYQICFMYMKNKHDTEDILQNTFIKLLESKKNFENEEHLKAWLIVISTNLCKNKIKHWWNKVTNDEIEVVSEKKEDETLKILLGIPSKYKTVLYLHYYMGYKTFEIANILKMNESTVRSSLRRGRALLGEIIKEDNNEKISN